MRAAAGAGPAHAVRHRLPHGDGTWVRDYIHVVDLADAHLRALRWPAPAAPHRQPGQRHRLLVRQVLDTIRQVTGHEVPVVDARAPAIDRRDSYRQTWFHRVFVQSRRPSLWDR